MKCILIKGSRRSDTHRGEGNVITRGRDENGAATSLGKPQPPDSRRGK